MAWPELSVDDLVERWDGVLLDAYGVLNDASGPLSAARDLLERLDRAGRPWRVVTNDASRLPETAADRFRSWGLPVPPERILSSGSLIPGWFEREGLRGAKTVVLGPLDSRRWVEKAGGEVVELENLGKGAEADVLVAADEAGFDLGPGLEAATSLLIRRFDADRPVRLLLPNPDVVFPRDTGRFGITAGAVAAVLEAVLEDRYGRREGLRFERLGKPETALFEEAKRQLGTDRLVMVGDQLQTDIAGARRAGIAAVLARDRQPADVGRSDDDARPAPDAFLCWPPRD